MKDEGRVPKWRGYEGRVRSYIIEATHWTRGGKKRGTSRIWKNQSAGKKVQSDHTRGDEKVR